MCKKTNHPDQSDLFEQEKKEKTPLNPFTHEAVQKYREEKKKHQEQTMEALIHLCQVAQGGSGQCHHVRRFLLGLYNCKRWPFELTRLRNLDTRLKNECLMVLELDIKAYQEIHRYIKGGDDLWREFWNMEDSEE